MRPIFLIAQSIRCNMRDKLIALIAWLLLLSLSACGPLSASSSTLAFATSTFTVSTPATLIASTETPTLLPNSAYSISELHMFDVNNGWAWASIINDKSSQYHLLRTTDGGRTWSDLSPQAFPYVRSGYFLDAQTAWLSTSDSLIHTTDGGKSWTVFDQTMPLLSVMYHFLNQTYGWAESSDIGAGNLYVRVFETMDSGKSWNPVIITPEHPDANLPAGTIHLCNICGDQFHYFPPNKVIITYGGMMNTNNPIIHLSISTNLGKSWHKFNLSVPAKYSNGWVDPYLMDFLNADSGSLVVEMNKQGANGNNLYRAMVLYTTNDGGTSWKIMPGVIENSTTDFQPQIDFLSPTDAFTVCSSELCVTHNGGRTWQMVTPNIDFGRQGTDRMLTQLIFVNPSNGWVIIADKDINHLYKTTDGGSTWDELPVKIPPR